MDVRRKVILPEVKIVNDFQFIETKGIRVDEKFGSEVKGMALGRTLATWRREFLIYGKGFPLLPVGK